MGKSIDLEVVIAHTDGMMSHGTVHELDGTKVLEVAFGIIHALEQFIDGFTFSFSSEEEEEGTYTLILNISEDSGKEPEEMDEIVESTMVLVTALSVMS